MTGMCACMRALVRIKTTRFKVVSRRTFCDVLFVDVISLLSGRPGDYVDVNLRTSIYGSSRTRQGPTRRSRTFASVYSE